MKLTIDDYIKISYKLRDDLDSGINKAFDWALTEYNLRVVENQVADRNQFHIPTKYIKSYDINSKIVPLNNDEELYHIIDLSMFEYFGKFLECMSYDMPNYAVFFYRWLRHDLCVSAGEMERARKYEPQNIPLNMHEMQFMSDRVMTKQEMNEYSLMVMFYFLHEYVHYLTAKPIRTAGTYVVEIIADTFLQQKSSGSKDALTEYIGQVFRQEYRRKWEQSTELREEVNCDIQALLCLFELPGLTNNEFSTEIILNAAYSFLTIQHIVYTAKHIDEELTIGNDFTFRQNIIATFAWLLEDEDYAKMIGEMMKKSNRFFVEGQLKTPPIFFKKQSKFWNLFANIFTADIQQQHNEDYLFPLFV